MMSKKDSSEGSKQPARRRRLRRIALVVLLVVVGLPVVLEVAARLWVRIRGIQLPFEYHSTSVMEPDPQGGPARLRPSAVFRFAGQTYQHNSLGTLGPEFSPEPSPDVLRVFACGASTTYFGDYPRALEAWLNRMPRRDGKRVEVINLGIPGYTSAASLGRLRQYLSYKPRLVMYYEAVNDAMQAFGGQPGGEAKRPQMPFFAPLEPILSRSVLLVFLTSLGAGEGNGGPRPGEEKGNHPPAGPLRFTAEPTAHAENLLRYRENVRSLIRESRHEGAESLLVTFVHWGQPHDPISEAVRDFNQALRELAPEEGAYLLDAAKEVTQRPSEHQPHFFDPIHFDPVFRDRLAELVGSFLQENLPLFAPANR